MPDPEGQLVTPVGHDSDDLPRSLVVDDDDNLCVNIDDQAGDVDVNIAAQAADVEIVQQNPADLRAGIHGHIGGAWQKQPLQFGYSGDKNQQITLDDALAGTNTLSSDVVPAGEIWILQLAQAWNSDNDFNKIAIYARINAITCFLVSVDPGIKGDAYLWHGSLVLSAGDSVRATFYGCTLNDALSFGYHAVRVDIDL